MSEYDYEQGYDPGYEAGYPGQPAPQSGTEAAEQMYYDDPFGTTVYAASQAGEMAAQAKMSEFEARYAQADAEAKESSAQINGSWAQQELQSRLGDFEKYKEMVAQEVLQNPDLYPEHSFKTPKGIVQQLERAYHIAKGTYESEAPSRRFAEIMAASPKSFRDIVGG